ncbi:MAG: YitT family protein [Parachlamydiales bacterium]|nr:YitT family protein [Parachlamydiales bacterium]
MKSKSSDKTSIIHYVNTYFWLTLGAFLAALAVKVFLAPNSLIDGGVVGLAMICAKIWGDSYLPLFYIIFNLPFIWAAYKLIGKTFVIQMGISVILFAFFCWTVEKVPPFRGESLEIVVVGGFILGAGIGLIIRKGASLDGTEILAIIINRQKGFTVGQVILFINIFIFAIAGVIYREWHVALMSLMIYIVASKVMDMVIVGLDETKSVIIISHNPHRIARALISELGVGLTVLYGRGGFTGSEREILYVIVERLQLAELKAIVTHEDPTAFVAIENLHEVINGRVNTLTRKKKLKVKHKKEQ